MTANLMIRTALTAMLLAGSVAAYAADDVAKSGEQLYLQYCASCHGRTGRGDGPVAKSLTVEVPDLTRYARRHGEFLDSDLVARIIDGRHVIAAHGTRTMPVWGDAFTRANLGDPNAERAARIQITRLADYVWRLQRPAQSSPQQ
jgi:mono/diheme cytochrome c family protein